MTVLEIGIHISRNRPVPESGRSKSVWLTVMYATLENTNIVALANYLVTTVA